MKNNQKEESRKAYAKNCRESYYQTLQSLIIEIMKAPFVKLHNLPQNEMLDFQKKIVDDFVDEATLVYALATALRYEEKAKSLIFITESGKAIDLLEVKKISENEVFNQILDHMDAG